MNSSVIWRRCAAAHAAVDRLDRLGPAEQRADPAREVVERVAVLGEDDQLAPLLAVASVARVLSSRIVRSSDHLRSVSDARTRAAALIRSREVEQLGVELLDRPRRGRRVDELVLDSSSSSAENSSSSNSSRSLMASAALGSATAAAGEDLLLAALEPLGAALQRAVDRLRARRQPPLQDREREPDGVAALAVELVGPVHPFADVGR